MILYIILILFELIILVLSQSEGCILEMMKYNDCTNITLSDSLSPGEISQFCNHFKREECDDFLMDIEQSISKCDYTGTKRKEYHIAKSLYEIKSKYLHFCAEDSNNKLCPYSNYQRKFNSLNDSEQTTGKDQNNNLLNNNKTDVLIENCKIDRCNRLFIIENEVDAIINIYINKNKEYAQDNVISTIINSYKNKRCDDIKNILSKDIVDEKSSTESLISNFFLTILSIIAIIIVVIV